MLYFGKTIHNPEKYLGSGTRWKYHISKHGKEFIETLWYCLFLDLETASRFAIAFSKENDIIKSEKWANLVNEDCIGGQVGVSLSNETKKKISEAKQNPSEKTRERMRISSKKRAPPSEETRLKRSISMKKTMTEDRIKRMSDVRIGKKHSEETRKKIAAANVRRASRRAEAKSCCL